MVDSFFYIQDNRTPQNDGDWIDFLGQNLANIVASVATYGVAQPIKFVVALGASVQAGYAADEVELLVQETTNPNEIQIGDDFYEIDKITDGIAAVSVTSAALALAGATALSVPGLAITGATGYVYSKFIDPITDDVLLTLDGKDELRMVDGVGNLLAGEIYPDGLLLNENQSVNLFISKAANRGIDVLGKTVKLKTDLLPALDYKVTDDSVFKKMMTYSKVAANDNRNTLLERLKHAN